MNIYFKTLLTSTIFLSQFLSFSKGISCQKGLDVKTAGDVKGNSRSLFRNMQTVECARNEVCVKIESVVSYDANINGYAVYGVCYDELDLEEEICRYFWRDIKIFLKGMDTVLDVEKLEFRTCEMTTDATIPTTTPATTTTLASKIKPIAYCTQGLHVPDFAINTMAEGRCSPDLGDDLVCQKTEGNIRVTLGTQLWIASASRARCVKRTQCKLLNSCAEFAEDIEKVVKKRGILVNGSRAESCNSRCCEGNFCNDKPVRDIKVMTTPVNGRIIISSVPETTKPLRPETTKAVKLPGLTTTHNDSTLSSLQTTTTTNPRQTSAGMFLPFTVYYGTTGTPEGEAPTYGYPTKKSLLDDEQDGISSTNSTNTTGKPRGGSMGLHSRFEQTMVVLLLTSFLASYLL